MSNKVTQPLHGPLPAPPKDLPPGTRSLLLTLENALVSASCSKVLVQMKRDFDVTIPFLLIDRLLRETQTTRILLLVSSAPRTALIATWKEATSWEDGVRLSERYRTAYSPNGSEARGARVCISTLREMQICQRTSRQFAQTFRVVLICDVPGTLSPVWRHVLEPFASSHLIGFCRVLTRDVREWFDNNVVRDEKEHPDTVWKALVGLFASGLTGTIRRLSKHSSGDPHSASSHSPIR
jgi:hypothetical protein